MLKESVVQCIIVDHVKPFIIKKLGQNNNGMINFLAVTMVTAQPSSLYSIFTWVIATFGFKNIGKIGFFPKKIGPL